MGAVSFLGAEPPSCHTMLNSLVLSCKPHVFTVAILAQGTSWAVAVTQAFWVMGSIPSGPHAHSMVGSAEKLRKLHAVTNTTWHTRLPNDVDLTMSGNKNQSCQARRAITNAGAEESNPCMSPRPVS